MPSRSADRTRASMSSRTAGSLIAGSDIRGCLRRVTMAPGPGGEQGSSCAPLSVMVEKAGHLVTSGEVRMKRVQRVSFVAAGAALLLGIPALASAAAGQTAAGSQPAAALAASGSSGAVAAGSGGAVASMDATATQA